MDAVISALGPSLKSSSNGTALTNGIRTIVGAMQDTGVRRFIGLATSSVPDERDLPTLQGRIIPLMAKTMCPRALAKVIGMSAAVTGSGLADSTYLEAAQPSATDQPGTANGARRHQSR